MKQDREQTSDEFIARSLSFTQWEFLAEHFSGEPRPMIYSEMRTRMAMISRGLVKGHPRQAAAFNPKFTVLTEKGHGVMCAAMGMMADMLTAMKQSDERLMEIGYGKRTAPARDQGDGELSLPASHKS